MGQNFGVSDTIYYTKIYNRINQFVDDIDFYLKLCKENDIFNPNLNYLRRDEQMQEKLFEFTLDTGEHVIISQSMKYDRLHQVNRVKWHHNINGEEFVAKLDMRCFFPQEMDAILRYSNFNIVHKLGDFERGEFIGDSKKQIYVCTVRDI